MAQRTGRTVLYAEDNPSIRALIATVVARRAGTRLLSADLGREAIELARRHHPDLVLLDLNLPDIPGEAVLAALRGDPATRDVPVVVISGDPSPDRVEQLRAAGARDYLVKPLDLQRLVTVLETYA
jgi:CheY-like chemotaxis protein